MAKHENLRGPENEPEETPEQAETSKQLREMSEKSEASQNRPISELSSEEIERILSERKIKVARDEGEKFVAERNERRNQFLQDLGEDMSIGEPHLPKLTVRGAEYVGIYRGGKYVGTINSEGGINGILTDKDFQDQAYDLVAKSMGKETSTERKEDKPRVKINIGSGVRELMAKNWITLDRDKLNLQYGQMELDLYDNGENEGIDLEKIDEEKILLRVTEKSGKIIEYTIDRGMFQPDSRRVKLGE